MHDTSGYLSNPNVELKGEQSFARKLVKQHRCNEPALSKRGLSFPYDLLNDLSAAIRIEVENERLSGLHCEEVAFGDGVSCCCIAFSFHSLSIEKNTIKLHAKKIKVN